MNLSIKKYFLLASFAWFTFASFIYFDHLVHYPTSYIEHFQIQALYDCFNPEDDIYRKEEAMEYAKSHGHEYEANMLLAMGFRFLKPTFSLWGYLQLIVVPIAAFYLLMCFIIQRKNSSLKESRSK